MNTVQRKKNHETRNSRLRMRPPLNGETPAFIVEMNRQRAMLPRRNYVLYSFRNLIFFARVTLELL